jgi:hypothetical protein
LNIDAWIESISKEAEAKSQAVTKKPVSAVKKSQKAKKVVKKVAPKKK